MKRTAAGRLRIWLPPLVVFLFMVLAPSTTFAQAGASAEAALKAYRLTIGDIRKWYEINRAFARLAQTNPELAEEEEVEDASVDDIVKRLESIPQAKNAIRAAGFTTRQFVLITLAYAGAGMAQLAVQQGADPGTIAADAGIHPSNLALIREYQAELERLQAELEALKNTP